MTTTTMNACWKTMALCVHVSKKFSYFSSFVRSFVRPRWWCFFFKSMLVAYALSLLLLLLLLVRLLLLLWMTRSTISCRNRAWRIKWKKQRRKTRSRSGQSGYFFISFSWLDLSGFFAQVLVRERESQEKPHTRPRRETRKRKTSQAPWIDAFRASVMKLMNTRRKERREKETIL